MKNILEINNLSKRYKNFKLSNINLALESGYVLGVIGKNGCGKTTLINQIIHKTSGYSGEIFVNGINAKKNIKQIRNDMGIVTVDNQFIPTANAMENGKYLSPFYNQFNIDLYKNWLKRFNVPMKTPVNELSKGTNIKFQLAFAISHNANLLVLDEPTNGLDPVFRKEFLEVMREFIQDENKGIIYSTNITSDLEGIADYILLIDNGEQVLYDSKENICDSFIEKSLNSNFKIKDLICNN